MSHGPANGNAGAREDAGRGPRQIWGRWRRWSRRHRRIVWALRLVLLLGLAIGLTAAPMACTTHIYPPSLAVAEGQTPPQRVTVLLIDHGRTPSLVLPREDGGHDRWAYGDFGWYAEGKTNPLRIPVVLLWPSRGGLGREQFGSTIKISDISASFRRAKVYTVQVSADEAHRLQRELTELWTSKSDTMVQEAGSGRLWFVHHPKSYSYFGNSNHVVARWLREVGCETRGPAFYSRWNVHASR